MTKIDPALIEAKLSLKGKTCQLKHSIKDPATNHPAVEYICQPMGYKESEVVDVSVYRFEIRICEECVEALYSDDWILLYCISCRSSQWIFKRLARLTYLEGMHIKWMDECPECKNGTVDLK